LRPLYHNDTINVRLTCKEKVDRDQKGKELPSGIVKWYVEVFDVEAVEEEDKLVAIATILTMVQKKQDTFHEVDKEFIENKLELLSEKNQPEWGMMTPQHMVEHLEMSLKIATGEISDFEVAIPEDYIEQVQETLYNYEKMPRGYKMPLMKKDELETLKHDTLEEAKNALLEAYEAYKVFFREHPEAVTKNAVFGELASFEWKLLNRKHFNHHFEQFGLI
jgi:oxepin-CoA hydrolase/3-oxo-5,6-dehydrosuberyl-CoA semialdehyde dehydrogenase